MIAHLGISFVLQNEKTYVACACLLFVLLCFVIVEVCLRRLIVALHVAALHSLCV